MSDFQRRIRSFVQRQGRVTAGQQFALDNYWEEYGYDFPGEALDWKELFGNNNPVVLEIGFGDGDSLLQMAQDNPGHNYFGMEVHKPGAGALINNSHRLGIKNIRVCMADAVDVLKQAVPDKSLHGVQIYFPDPWHKKRHNKRRLVQAVFVELLAAKVSCGGFLHLATDWEEYAEQMLEVIDASTAFENTQGAGNYLPRPDFRPLTKFENRGLKRGHGVWDLMYQRK